MFDIEGYLSRNFDDMKPYGNPQTDWSINCTQCDDTGKHLNVSIDKHVVHCWRCGYSTSWVDFVMATSGIPYHKALAELYVAPTVRGYTEMKASLKVEPAVRTAAAGSVLPDDFQPLHTVDDSFDMYKAYMLNRGFDRTQWQRYNIGVAPSIMGRIIIPIEDGYWQGRSIHKWLKPKYINPKSEARDIIFNSSALLLYDEVIICEGAFSAMAVGTNAVAMIGKEATEEKLQRFITSAVGHFIIALEQDAWGTVKSLAEGLYKSGKQVTIWRFVVGDPADRVHSFDVMEYDVKARMRIAFDM